MRAAYPLWFALQEVETVDQLKNISQTEHSRHRSPFNFLVNLIAYCYHPKKPALDIHNLEPKAIPQAIF